MKNVKILTLVMLLAIAACGKHDIAKKPDPQPGPPNPVVTPPVTPPVEPFKGTLNLTPFEKSAAKYTNLLISEDKLDDAELAKRLPTSNARFKTNAPKEVLLRAQASTDGKKVTIAKGDIRLKILDIADGKPTSVDLSTAKVPVVKVGETVVAMELNASKKTLVSKDEVSIELKSIDQVVTVTVDVNETFTKAIKADFPTSVALKTQDAAVKEITLDGNNEKLSTAEILATSGYKGTEATDPNKPNCDMMATGIADVKPIWINGLPDLLKRDEAIPFDTITKTEFAKLPAGSSPLEIGCSIAHLEQSPSTVMAMYSSGYTLKVVPKKAEEKKEPAKKQ